MRFELLVVACCVIGCGPPQAVDRVLVGGMAGRGGSAGRTDARAGTGGSGGQPAASTGGSAGGAAGAAGSSGPGGDIDNPSGGRGGSVADAGTPPIDAAPEASPTPTPPPPDAAPPSPDVAAPPPDMPALPPVNPCPMPAADEVIASFRGALTTDQVGDRGGTSWSVLTGTDQIPGVAGAVALGTGPARCGNTDFLRFTGTATAMRAPITRAQLRETSGGSAQFVNASAFKGIRLVLRSMNGGRVRVKLPDRNTATAGGVCTLCSDHFAIEVDVTSDWQLFKIPFADLKQTGTGDPQPALATTVLWALEITAPKTATFTLDVDDISFFR